MRLSDLQNPFPEEMIEWRIGRCGAKGNGQVWASCLAYVQARAIMDRLDEVCGPQNWKTAYRFESCGVSGVVCMLSIKTGDEWVTKEDGAEQTDIEAFKGGISSALKRAAVAWGIGRYLYDLESGWAIIVEKGVHGANYAKTKEGKEFYWVPPKLPVWALPPIEQKKAESNLAERAQVRPQQPKQQDGVQHNDWTFPSGTLALKRPSDCSLESLIKTRDAIMAKYPEKIYPVRTGEALKKIEDELASREPEDAPPPNYDPNFDQNGI